MGCPRVLGCPSQCVPDSVALCGCFRKLVSVRLGVLIRCEISLRGRRSDGGRGFVPRGASSVIPSSRSVLRCGRLPRGPSSGATVMVAPEAASEPGEEPSSSIGRPGYGQCASRGPAAAAGQARRTCWSLDMGFWTGTAPGTILVGCLSLQGLSVAVAVPGCVESFRPWAGGVAFRSMWEGSPSFASPLVLSWESWRIALGPFTRWGKVVSVRYAAMWPRVAVRFRGSPSCPGLWAGGSGLRVLCAGWLVSCPPAVIGVVWL